MNQSAAHRTEIAARVADEVLQQGPNVDVWLYGALATGRAHALSDIDICVIDNDPHGPARSRIVDGVRVDFAVKGTEAPERLRTLVADFSVTFDNVESFREVRGSLSELVVLRTALRREHGRWAPVADAAMCLAYQRWAVADRVQVVLSLTEDLLGLATDRLLAEADIVWHQLALALAGLRCAAHGLPVLGDKWLPSLTAETGRNWSTIKPPEWNNQDHWFASIRDGVLSALSMVWPIDLNGHTADLPQDLLGVGWLPQHYADGWFLQKADDRIQISEAQMRAWCLGVGVSPGAQQPIAEAFQ